MNPCHVRAIVLSYKTVNDSAWQRIQLSPWEYYECENQQIEDDSIPLHNHARDYLDLEYAQVRVTRLELHGSQGTLTTTETYWDDGESRVIESVETGEEPGWELIVSIQTDASRSVSTDASWVVVRLTREEDAIRPTYHATIHDNPNGTQTEVKYFPERRTLSGE